MKPKELLDLFYVPDHHSRDYGLKLYSKFNLTSQLFQRSEVRLEGRFVLWKAGWVSGGDSWDCLCPFLLKDYWTNVTNCTKSNKKSNKPHLHRVSRSPLQRQLYCSPAVFWWLSCITLALRSPSGGSGRHCTELYMEQKIKAFIHKPAGAKHMLWWLAAMTGHILTPGKLLLDGWRGLHWAHPRFLTELIKLMLYCCFTQDCPTLPNLLASILHKS